MKRDIFEATEDFAGELFELIDLPLVDDSDRFVVSHISCSMSLEHWQAMLQLLMNGLLPSALVIHRAQFEALLRSIWVLYAANEGQIDKLSAVVTAESEQNAKNLPQVVEMMDALQKKAPPQAYDALNRFKEHSWKALNSYAHAGIHPIARHADGYPVRLLEDVAKNANGVAVVSAMQAVVLAGDQPLQSEILKVAEKYPECMPPRL